MNLFDEFFAVVKGFQKDGIRYAVIGGVALALYDQPRFTRDIDLLVHPEDVEKVPDAMKKIGYFESSKPWTFADTQLTLHRFMKVEGEDHLVVDILTGLQNRHRQIVDRATDQSWKDGVVKVARKNDLIWMKKQRGSDQDKVDIGKLKNDNNREGGPRTK